MLLFYRIHLASPFPDDSGGGIATGLLWNLFLAFVPLIWSSAFQAASAGRRPILASLYFFLWLLFLPNAPEGGNMKPARTSKVSEARRRCWNAW